jgi:hypothetical protein
LAGIGDFCFELCDGKCEFVVPMSVTKIHDRAFRANNGRTVVEIDPESQLSSIDTLSFSETAITKLFAPRTLSSVGSGTFIGRIHWWNPLSLTGIPSRTSVVRCSKVRRSGRS